MAQPNPGITERKNVNGRTQTVQRAKIAGSIGFKWAVRVEMTGPRVPWPTRSPFSKRCCFHNSALISLFPHFFHFNANTLSLCLSDEWNPIRAISTVSLLFSSITTTVAHPQLHHKEPLANHHSTQLLSFTDTTTRTRRTHTISFSHRPSWAPFEVKIFGLPLFFFHLQGWWFWFSFSVLFC